MDALRCAFTLPSAPCAQDFEDKDYNVKKAGYWELGRLGPDLSSNELQAKRENQERVKAMAAQVRQLTLCDEVCPS